MKPSTSVATHIIVFKDRTKKFINEKAYKFIWDKSVKGEQMINIGGTLINLYSITQLTSISEYYSQHPEERPKEIKTYKQIEQGKGFSGIISASRKEALQGMLKGITKYIKSDQYQGTQAPLELKKQMELRLAEPVDNSA